MTADTIVSDPQLRSVLDAAASARKQCEDILELIAAQKYTQDEASSQEKLLFSRLAVVRGLNRRAILDVRKTKQETADARHEIDTLHLQLQNLYYEQRHLRGEIALCENYDHSYQKLPLVPVDEYLTSHPEHAELDEHALMNVRIEHEHADRQSLEEARQSLLKRKQTLISENNKRKEVLAGLDRRIEEWIEGSVAVDREFSKCEQEMGKIGRNGSAAPE